jgi:hypothetical protein
MGAFIFLVVLLGIFSQVHGIVIPGPDSDHKYKSAVAEISLTDPNRKDPWNMTENRKTMVSVFIPIPVASCASECKHPYMSNEAAKIANDQFFHDKNKGVFEKMEYTVCCKASQVIDASKIPVVVLEPHTDTSRLMYATLARYMTANNVAVVLIDHPHDSAIVEFKDPSSAIAWNSGLTGLSNFSPLTTWNSTVTNAMDIRIKDINFVLTALQDPALLTANFPNIHFANALKTTSYSIVGHGLGGTVATSLSATDPHVRFSINLSGSAPLLAKDTASAVYFLGRANFRREHDINWPSAWKHLTGPATEFELENSDIMDFTDLSTVVDLAQTQGGFVGLKARGLGSTGPLGNDAVKCWVEAYIRDDLGGEDTAVSNCVRLFSDRMVPYSAAKFGARSEDKKSGGVSVRAGMRRMLRSWGYM